MWLSGHLVQLHSWQLSPQPCLERVLIPEETLDPSATTSPLLWPQAPLLHLLCLETCPLQTLPRRAVTRSGPPNVTQEGGHSIWSSKRYTGGRSLGLGPSASASPARHHVKAHLLCSITARGSLTFHGVDRPRTHPSIGEYLCCFTLGVLSVIYLTNIHIQLFVWIIFSIFLGICSGVKLLGPTATLWLTSWATINRLFSKVATPCYTPTGSLRGTPFLPVLPSTSIVLICAIPVGVKR